MPNKNTRHYTLHFSITQEAPNRGHVEVDGCDGIPIPAITQLTLVLLDWVASVHPDGYERALEEMPRLAMANRAKCAAELRAKRKEGQ